MARPLRIEYPGAFYHVFQHGLGSLKLFENSRDRVKFIEYLELANKKFSARMHCYCLMDSHYHLIVETPNGNLNRIMHTINVGYSVYYNRKRQRKGPLFMGRYKAVVVDADSYLHYLSAYIHLNPVKAGLVSDPGDFEFSSFKYFIDKKDKPDWLVTDFILGMFGEAEQKAKRNYSKFIKDVQDYVDQKIGNNTKGAIIGDTDFVEYVKEEYINADDEHNIPDLKALNRNYIDYDVIRDAVNKLQVCDMMKRDLRIYLAKEYSGYTLKQIGDNEAGMTCASVCMQAKRFKQKLAKSEAWADYTDKLEKMLNVKI